jgi:hypothetical protein
MNERIKELALKAGGGLSCIAEPLEHPWKFSERELEKFAELIVRECADIAKHHVMNIPTYADADFVDEQIKEHFGVEE